MTLIAFLAQVIVISLSGVMAPGPVTAAAIGLGSHNKHAGISMAAGHAIVELPLMVIIILGAGRLFRYPTAQTIIALAGGVFLLLMALQMFAQLRANTDPCAAYAGTSPLTAGILLSATNPYFLIWWATVGLALATRAGELGIWAFALFAMVHLFCDLIWLEILSWATFKGSRIFGPKSQKVVLTVCAGALLIFGIKFLFDALVSLTG
jgi:threonine/homoserine/homoserine lactone efflux protein